MSAHSLPDWVTFGFTCGALGLGMLLGLITGYIKGRSDGVEHLHKVMDQNDLPRH